MKLFAKLRRKKTRFPEWGQHSVEVFLDMPSFYERISNTSEFDNRDVYYYRGELSNLKSLISNEYCNGERDINDISLEYITFKKKDDVNHRILLEWGVFFPDSVKEIKCLNPYYRYIYQNEDDKLVPIKSVLIAKEGVYFCSK